MADPVAACEKAGVTLPESEYTALQYSLDVMHSNFQYHSARLPTSSCHIEKSKLQTMILVSNLKSNSSTDC